LAGYTTFTALLYDKFLRPTAINAAEAADDCGGKADDAEQQAGTEIDLLVIKPVHDAGESGERRTMVVTELLKPSQSRGPCKGSLEPDAREEDVKGRRKERLSSLMHGDRLHSCHGLLLPDLAAVAPAWTPPSLRAIVSRRRHQHDATHKLALRCIPADTALSYDSKRRASDTGLGEIRQIRAGTSVPSITARFSATV
jgi:hypothetical protein